MRQRAQPQPQPQQQQHTSPRSGSSSNNNNNSPHSGNGTQQIKQRRRIAATGREPVTSWEITSERSLSPEAPPQSPPPSVAAAVPSGPATVPSWESSSARYRFNKYNNYSSSNNNNKVSPLYYYYYQNSSFNGSLWQAPQEEDEEQQVEQNEYDYYNVASILEAPGGIGGENDLASFHLRYRTPLHVPDNQYETYLLGYNSKKRKRNAPIFTKSCCAHTCGGFSIVATIFLLFVGVLIDTQPLYIKGTLPQLIVQQQGGQQFAKRNNNNNSQKKTKKSSFMMVKKYQLPDEERLPAAKTAYRTALVYALTAMACYMMLYPGWLQSKWYRWKKRYQDIPDDDDDSNHYHYKDRQYASSTTDSTLPMFYTFGDGDDDHNAHYAAAGATTTAAYKVHVWDRASALVRQWLTARGWYGMVRKKFHRKHEQKIG